MNRHLDDVLNSIANDFKGNIDEGARNYIEIDIGKRAKEMGYFELTDKYSHVNAIVPIKNPEKGMKVRIDGRTFVNYAKYDSGIAVPGYVAKDTGMAYETFIPNDSMILNFA